MLAGTAQLHHYPTMAVLVVALHATQGWPLNSPSGASLISPARGVVDWRWTDGHPFRLLGATI